MKKHAAGKVFFCAVLTVFSIFILGAASFAQTADLLKRTTYKTETVELGAGGTVSIVGAPNGSMTIEGWQKNSVEISAEIEMQAPNEAALAELAKVDGFAIDEDTLHIRITSVGTHDKDYMKRVAKKFPKNLLGMPFRIDYKIKVPAYCDLEIDGGKGDLTLSKVEGAVKINYLDGDARLDLVGGSLTAAFGSGSVVINIPNRSWRGRSVEAQLINGTMKVETPLNLNANLDATVLRTGKVENNLTNLKPRDRTKFTEQAIIAKAGSGGAILSFTVGDGTLRLNEIAK